MNIRGLFKAIALAVAMVVGAVGCSTGLSREEKATKVLMIGNSFSVCLLEHLPNVAADRGVDLDLCSLYIGGCTLKRHWENAEKDDDEDFKPYKLCRNQLGRITRCNANVCEALRMADWDIVTIQQGSHDSWIEKRYEPYGGKLVAKIRELAPHAKIYVQETWSYTPWDKRLAKWGIDQNEMYEKLHTAYAKFAAKYSLKTIPFGTAVQKWRKRLPVEYTDHSFGGDVVGGGHQDVRDHFKRDVNNKWVPNCDVFHLNLKGEYFQSLVWAVSLFDVDLSALDYCPTYVTEKEAELMREIAAGLE